ncbi:UDP-N-acetylmuramate dehydrogenase [Thalassotalea crassostreae]|uniref:UDP-N-acetylmuramate dehydrogenase n=1 Tax=Thalassotalea crassostreae TaxID=1763536 RepID=UPI000838ACE7|nr:UDP-N-acetylmuramate dehydrogenase [Thalassotalea crassostreae]
MHYQNYSLEQLNSFALKANAKSVVIAESVDAVRQFSEQLPEQFYILGGGSNSLFIDNYQGTIFCPNIKGIEISETNEDYLLHVSSGEDWHDLVEYCLANNMPGLENLALIPGNCGAAPIQNIGAYGVELAHFCDYVQWFDFQTNKEVRLTAEQCQFGYRDSIFKGALKNKGVIIAIGLRLTKKWQPTLKYQGLNQLGETPTAKQVFDAVVNIRQSKLPDPEVLPNAGSFFKNPVVSHQVYAKIKAQYEQVPAYPANGCDMKLAAGWLIEQSGLKGVSIGGAAVHTLQALVLVNKNNATGQDVVALAQHVQRVVNEKFNVMLEPEVRVIGESGEQLIADIEVVK